jgi:hypothetical protein
MRRLALLLLCGTLLALFVPLFLRGRVAYPHDNAVEVGLAVPRVDPSVSKRRLTDASAFYVPTLHQHLNGNTAGWLSTWDPHVELGRPTLQLYGLGKAFLLTRVFAWFSSDALSVYTWSAVAAIVLTCLFGFLLLEALGLHPLACLAGALGLGIGSLTFSCFCFTLFLWGMCWEVALFWSVTTFVRRPSLARGLALAFFTHALLLTAYPQAVIWKAYPLAAYALLLLVRGRHGAARARAVALAACVLVGAASALPVYLDLLANARLGSRLEFDPEFFENILPDLASWPARGAFVATLLDAFSFGSPQGEEYPFQSALLLPLWSGLAVVGLALGDLRRYWPLHVFVAAMLVLTVWPDAHVLAVRFLGLGLSRSSPLHLCYLPSMVLAALAADRALRGTLPRRVLLALAGAIGLVAAGAFLSGHPVSPWDSLLSAAIALGTAAFLVARRGWILVGLALTSALVYGQRLQVTQRRDAVALDSPLVELVRRETADGTRMAWVGESWKCLPPNVETLLGLHSIHTYNPLLSRRFQDWAARWREVRVIGPERRFLFVIELERFLRGAAALSATEILLSRQNLPPSCPPLERIGSVGVFRSGVPPLRELQTETWQRTGPEDARIESVSSGVTTLTVERTSSRDERLEFRVTPSERETLLFVSQQYHPHWRARAGGRPLATLAVNGVFQGVLVPPGTVELELSYHSPARWSWIPQALFALAALLLVARRLRG